MLVPESWLRSYIDPDLSTEDLAHKLTMAGLEVEEIHSAAQDFSGVVVAEVTHVQKHPDADRLRICQVDDGSGEALQIVCGAPNVRAGVKFPLARICASLPGGFKIKKSKLRGAESFGMLCSAKELGIAADADGLFELSPLLATGADLREALSLDEAILEIKLTPNRGDCLSILGIAREVHALTGAPMHEPEILPVPARIQETPSVDIQDKDLCGRFVCRVIRGVDANAPTPDYIKQRLERAGQRSISALVDISNYVMLELGRPNHVYDLDKLTGPLQVRWAKPAEKLKLLNGNDIELDERCGVVCAGDHPEGLAGVMGGDHSAVTLATRNILIEGAFWFPEAIAGLTRRFKIGSEAAHRFERGVDFQRIDQHIEWMTQLILDICGGEAGPLTDKSANLPARQPVGMRIERCRQILGMPVSREEAARIFKQLGFEFSESEDGFEVTPPSYRFDLSIEEDLIEEVARIHGYDNLPEALPTAVLSPLLSPETQRTEHHFREVLADLDYQEVINFSFIAENIEQGVHDNDHPVRLLNPISSQLSVMRSSLIGGLLQVIEYNARRQQNRVRCFEIGKVFLRDDSIHTGPDTVKGVRQPVRIAAAAWGLADPEQWAAAARQVDFFDLKQDLLNLCGKLAEALVFERAAHPALHPGRSANILLQGKPIGIIGELHPKWMQALSLKHPPVIFELDFAAVQHSRLHAYAGYSTQPVVMRDLAVWVSQDVSFAQILDELKCRKDLPVLKHVELFDIWKDPKSEAAERSLALRFSLQGAASTLSDQEVDGTMQQILSILQERFAARLR